MYHRIVVTDRGGSEVMEMIEERLPEPKAAAVRAGDVVFDTVSGVRQLWRSYRAVRNGGRLGHIGSAGIKTGRLSHGRHAGKIVLAAEPGTSGSEPSSWT